MCRRFKLKKHTVSGFLRYLLGEGWQKWGQGETRRSGQGRYPVRWFLWIPALPPRKAEFKVCKAARMTDEAEPADEVSGAYFVAACLEAPPGGYILLINMLLLHCDSQRR